MTNGARLERNLYRRAFSNVRIVYLDGGLDREARYLNYKLLFPRTRFQSQEPPPHPSKCNQLESKTLIHTIRAQLKLSCGGLRGEDDGGRGRVWENF